MIRESGIYVFYKYKNQIIRMNKSTLIRLLVFVGLTFVSLTILLLCGVDISQKLSWGGVILAGVICLPGILENYIKI